MRLANILLIAAALRLAPVDGKRKKTKVETTTTKKKNKSSAQRAPPGSHAIGAAASVSALGVSLTFTDPEAAPLLVKWSTALGKSGGSVSHGQAVAREQYVVEQVNAGAWSPEAYHEYQRLASATGNVDSARLLLQ